MSSQTTEPAEPVVSEKRTERLVRVDLRDVLLYIFFESGSWGITREEIPGRFAYWGCQEKSEIVVSPEKLTAVIETLKKEGLVVEAERQIGSGGTTGMFLSLAEGVKLTTGPVA